MKLTSFSIPSKPSSKITKPSTFSDEPAEKPDDGPQFVSEFDSSAPLTLKPKSITIPRQENTWRPESKMKNIALPAADLQFEASAVDEDGKTDVTYGLNLRNRANGSEQPDQSAAEQGKSYVESLWDQKYREDMEKLADEDDVDKYREVPVENFAAAVLASYGWSEGKGIGRNAKKDVPVYEHPRRLGGGFGAMVDRELQRRIKLGKVVGNGVGAQGQSDEMKNTNEQFKEDSIRQENSRTEENSKNNYMGPVQRSRNEEQEDERHKRKDLDGDYGDRRDRKRDVVRTDKSLTEGGSKKNDPIELVGRSRNGGDDNDQLKWKDWDGDYEDKRDRNRDERRADKRLREDGRKDHVLSSDYKEKRVRSRNEEKGGRSVDYEDKGERRRSDKSGDRSGHGENQTDYKSRGDEKLRSRSKDDKGHSKKGEDGNREMDTRRDDQSIHERKGEGRGVSWLTSHIRVRVISKVFRGGKFYLKKGEVVDVVQPRKCIVSMDGSKEIIEGVNQDILETALPKRGGPVIILYGKHKGVFGKLVKRDAEEETGLVQDAKTSEMISVVLDQIAEYVGDPSYIGY